MEKIKLQLNMGKMKFNNEQTRFITKVIDFHKREAQKELLKELQDYFQKCFFKGHFMDVNFERKLKELSKE